MFPPRSDRKDAAPLRKSSSLGTCPSLRTHQCLSTCTNTHQHCPTCINLKQIIVYPHTHEHSSLMNIHSPASTDITIHRCDEGKASQRGSTDKRINTCTPTQVSSEGLQDCAVVQFSNQEQLLFRDVKRFRGRLVFKAHTLLYHTSLDSTVIKKKKKKEGGQDCAVASLAISFRQPFELSTQEIPAGSENYYLPRQKSRARKIVCSRLRTFGDLPTVFREQLVGWNRRVQISGCLNRIVNFLFTITYQNTKLTVLWGA